MLAHRVWLSVMVGLAVAAVAADARAGGFEYPAPGARALGRAGAYYARADDPMALLYNPANLAGMSGAQLMLDAHLTFFDACYTREGSYAADLNYRTRFDGDPMGSSVPGDAWAYDASGNPRAYPQVCNEGPPNLVPELAFTYRLNRMLGFGIGMVAPSAVGHTEWGDDLGVIEVSGQQLPSPARYLLVRQNNIIAMPAVGVGFSPFKQLRVGASFLWGIGVFDFTTYTVPTTGPEFPHKDVRTTLEASDVFIPGLVASVHVVPIDQLDIMVGARLMDTIHGSGTTTLEHGVYGVGVEGVPVQSSVENTLVLDTELDAPQPWQFAFGARYGHRITERPEDPDQVERLSGRVEDAMSNEWWDVELDVVYEMNSRLEEFDVRTDLGTFQLSETDPTGAIVGSDLSPPTRIRVPKRWNDQLSIRLGGDFNVIPGMASLRGGVSFETSGLDEGFANIDFIPAQRIGIHAGLTVRLGRFDITLAYAHIFQETVEVSAAEAALPKIEADSMNPGIEGGATINAGTYDVNFDVLALGVNWHI